ncbi:hypothetical protein [Spirosoma litoris]
MKTFVTSALLLFTLISCKKEDIDQRDQYLGNYDIVAKEAGPNNTESQSSLIIAKSEKVNGLTLSFQNGILPATIGGNGTFTLDPYTVSTTNAKGFPVNQDFEGEGAITDKSLLMNLRVTIREVGKTTKSTATITGTRK